MSSNKAQPTLVTQEEKKHKCVEDEEVFVSNNTSDEHDDYFDLVVGTLQDIVMGDGFQALQDGFIKQHVGVFADTEENKHEYFTIFQQWEQSVESLIVNSLKQSLENFEFEAFLKILAERQDEIDPELLDILVSLSDFAHFKELMLSYKKGSAMNLELNATSPLVASK